MDQYRVTREVPLPYHFEEEIQDDDDDDVDEENASTRLKWLHRRPGMRQNELAEQLDMEPIAVGRVIDRLQAAGFVERRPDPKDRRAWRLHDTEQARGVIDDMEDISRGLRRDATLGIDAADLEKMLAVLERIKENLQALDGPSEES